MPSCCKETAIILGVMTGVLISAVFGLTMIINDANWRIQLIEEGTHHWTIDEKTGVSEFKVIDGLKIRNSAK